MMTTTGAFRVSTHDLVRTERAEWCAEASSLRFPVGRWPMKLLLTDVEGPDILLRHVRAEQSGAVHLYESVDTAATMILTIFND